MNIGLQTYTVKKLIGSFNEMDAALKNVAAMGIKHIEIAVDYLKMPYNKDTAEQIAQILNKYGIQAVSIQIRYNKVAQDLERTLQFLSIINAKYITISLFNIKSLLKGKEGIMDFINRLNSLVDIMRPHGITVGHHNHHYEFLRYGNLSVMDIMADNYKGEFVLDTYWIQRGGGNHLVLLDKLKGRVSIVHLRDYKLKFKCFDLLGTDSEIGEGNLPFESIIEQAEKCGVKYGMIEQSTKTPLESVNTSYSNIISFIKGE